MKKVSFIAGSYYEPSEVEHLPDYVMTLYFTSAPNKYDYQCTESFTAEITVKIVPYEQ